MTEDADDDRFPTPNPGPARDRIALRLLCTAGLVAVFVAWGFEFLVRAAPLLWPPTDPLSRWFGFVLVQVGVLVVVPGVFGSLLADRLYARYFADDSE
jgi:hypothetical protein